jgi:monovalent cation/hydrogen antiporter
LSTLEWTLALVAGSLLLSAFARRLGVPYPTFLAIGGAALVALPGAPDWTLEPDLALAILVAPVLGDAAYQTSLRDLKRYWLPIASLVIGAVGLTTIVVAFVVRRFVPDLPWAAAIALGALVAPPDAAAAAAILNHLKLPRRVLKILEGESLLNDASALLIYRIAVSVTTMGQASVGAFAPMALLTLVGSVVAGYACGRLMILLMTRIANASTLIILQFVAILAVWILAEHSGLSGILTTVAYALTLAQFTPETMPAHIRLRSAAVWDAMVLLLNVLAFALIGMQIGPVWTRIDQDTRAEYLIVSVVVLLTIILVRFAWLLIENGVARLTKVLHRRDRSDEAAPSTKHGLIMSWCGMRGIVTLAAAFALPEHFPHRDLMLLTAFAVVLGTLVLQGFTLKPIIVWLDMASDSPFEGELSVGRAAAFRAALAEIDNDKSEEAELLRREYRLALDHAQAHPQGRFRGELPVDAVRRRAIRAARNAVLALRTTGAISQEAHRELEEELDWADIGARESGSSI